MGRDGAWQINVPCGDGGSGAGPGVGVAQLEQGRAWDGAVAHCGGLGEEGCLPLLHVPLEGMGEGEHVALDLRQAGQAAAEGWGQGLH